MNSKDKDVVGVFSAMDDTHNDRTIFVCQISTTHYHGHLQYRKKYYLDSPVGPKVYPTDDPSVYQLLDGTKLKLRR